MSQGVRRECDEATTPLPEVSRASKENFPIAECKNWEERVRPSRAREKVGAPETVMSA